MWPLWIFRLTTRLDTPHYQKEGADVDGKLHAYIEAAVVAYREESGDTIVHVLATPEADMQWPDDGGSIEHWGASGMIKFAHGLKAALEQLPSAHLAEFLSLAESQ